MYLIDYLDFAGVATWNFYRGPTLLFSQAILPKAASGDTVAAGNPDLDGSVGFIGHVAQSAASAFDRIVINFTAGTGEEYTGLDNFFVGSVFQISVVNVQIGQSIQFTDTSTNTPTSWLWNFGDGTTSTLQNPTKTYSTVGTRTVTLTATNANGSGSVTKTGYVVVT